jgi:hypothetical protein
MPQIKTNKTGGIIRWDFEDFKTLVPQFKNSTYGVNSLTSGLAWTVAMNPNRQPGFAVPGVDPSNLTNVSVIDGVQKNGITASTKAYTVGGDNLHQTDLTTDTITNGGAWPHTISAHGGHTTVAASDIIKYNIGGTDYAFYSWSDNTDGDVGRFDLSSTFDDDWMSTIPTGGAVLTTTNPHAMKVFGNILYITDGRSIASYRGLNNTFNPSSLDLPEGYIATSFATSSNFLVIYAYRASVSGGTNYRTESKAFFWDTYSDSWTYEYDLSANYVNGGFVYNGVPGCFVSGGSADVGSTKNSRAMLFNGQDFDPLFTFPESIPGHGGVETSDVSIMCNAGGGVVYQYGTPHIGLDMKNAVNRIADIDGSSNEGMLRTFFNSKLYASAGTTTNGGLQLLNTNYDSNCIIRTPQVSLPFSEYSKARVRKVKFFWSALASTGHKARVVLLYDNTKNGEVIRHATRDATGTVEEVTYETDATPLPIFYRIGWELNYAAGTASAIPDALQAIELIYENVKT